jgi:hypothetical protein
MPKPFLELTVDQFADLVLGFPWNRTISSVHLHHTFRPNHSDFASRPPAQSIEGMFRFHTETRGFSDIAQHVTVDPTGKIWTGRNFNMPPASSTGFNGNSKVGPFMIEMIGNFDVGNDRWEGAQREAAIAVVALVQKLHRLSPSAFQFHHDMNPKSCPGTSIKRAEVLAEIEAAHARIPAIPSSRERAATDRLFRLLDVGARSVGPLRDEGELPEDMMTLTERAMSAGQAEGFRAARGGDDRDLTPEDRDLLRRHVINLRMGALSSGGEFQTSRDDVLALFAEHMPAFLEARKREGHPLRLVFFAHGGLNEELESLKNARNRIPSYLENKCYPIFFVWETGVKETLVDVIREIIGLGPGRGIFGAITDFTDPALEVAFRNGGFAMWANMKRSAELAFLPRQGGTFFVEQLVEFWKQHSSDMEIHAIGHSAGTIFHAQFLSMLCQQPSNPPLEVRSVHYLAPAITVDLFKELMMPLVGNRVKTLTEFTMRRDFEVADAVGPYRKSLLYLVSRSFEDAAEMPILGLEESIRRDPDLVRFFGLLGNKAGRGEILFSTQEEGASHSTIAKKHGDFDNDRFTMSGVIRRILRIGDDTPITEFPETVSRNILDAVAAPVRPAAPSLAAALVATVPPPVLLPAASGRQRAVCVGIDQYPPPNALSGCVNDANDWAAALRGFGFDVAVVTNQDATWKGLNDALNGLVSSARPGDVLVLQYAGHGTLVDDLDGDEQGNRDSALCPVDFMSGGFLIDDDLRRIFSGLPDGVSVTCFFDCCHSGTITRLAAPGPVRIGGDVRRRFLNATPEMLAAHRRFRQSVSLAPAAGRGPLTMKEVSFTACTDAQTAQEVDGHGQFTVRAMDILRRGLGGLTNEEFHTRVVAAFGSGVDAQTPQLDCAPTARVRPLFGGLASGAPAGPASADMGAIVARLNDMDRRLTRLGV